MPSNLYLTLDEFKRRIDAANDDWSVAESDAAERIIEAVSRKADTLCARHFYATATGVARYFTALDSSYLCVDDLVSIDASGLVTDEDGDRTYETTWATTDYDLWPYNAAGLQYPYTELRVTPSGDLGFPTLSKSVKITGSWGWPAVPPEIAEAVFLESARVWQQGHSPSGVVASADLGQFVIEPGMHPTVRALLAPFRKNLFAGAV